jgi:ribosomal protein L9
VKLILQESIPSLGEAGDLVRVRPGYARNYLIPRGKATFATEASVKQLEHQKRVVAGKVAKQLQEFGAQKTWIEGLALEVKARVGEAGKSRDSRWIVAASSCASPSRRRASTPCPSSSTATSWPSSRSW